MRIETERLVIRNFKENDAAGLLRYIHQNPVKAGIVEKMEDYKYSSYKEYLNNRILADTAFSLTMVGREEWIRLHHIFEEEKFKVAGKTPMNEEQSKYVKLSEQQEYREV
jgi:hypothetical protein